MPRDPRGHLEQLKVAHRTDKARVEELEGAAVGFREVIADSQRERRAVASVEQRVSAAADHLADFKQELNEADRKAEELNERSAVRARDLFSVRWHQVDRSRVLAVPVVELEERVRKHQDISKQRAEEEDGGPDDGARPPGQGRLGVAGAIFVVGVLILLLGSRDALALAIGIGAVTGSFVLGAWWRAHVVRADGIRERWSDSIATLKSEEEAARDGVRKLVGELPIRAWLLEPPISTSSWSASGTWSTYLMTWRRVSVLWRVGARSLTMKRVRLQRRWRRRSED